MIASHLCYDEHGQLCNASDFSYRPVDKCRGCHEAGDLIRGFCDDCRTICPLCRDWLSGSPETLVEGKRCHTTCIEDEQEQAKLLAVLTDAYVQLGGKGFAA